MGWRVAMQPDGKLAVFSSVVDDFIMLDATSQDVIDLIVEDAVDSAKLAAERMLKRCASNTFAWVECNDTIEAVHGKERRRDAKKA